MSDNQDAWAQAFNILTGVDPAELTGAEKVQAANAYALLAVADAITRSSKH